jgi:hypothetical protein
MAEFYADENFWDWPDVLATRIDQMPAAAGPLAGKHLRVNRPP